MIGSGKSLRRCAATVRLMRTTALCALAAGLASPALAQDQQPADTANQGATAAPTVDPSQPAAGSTPGAQPESQGIVITGFRASIRSALNEKRRSNVQIDAINAEDIADFPDANLAESLQRLPGVSIDRDNGEGRTITVRGLSGEFNRTRINGLEALATAGANIAGDSPNRTRSFDYNTFASELFNSLKVQKTASAETDEGSLGATIDLQTARPFDYKKSTFALSTEGNYQKNSKKWSPRISGLVSTKFLDGKMGLLVSAAYSKSFNAIDQYARQAGQPDYLYRGTSWAGNENPPRAGFSAPTGTTFGSVITNPQAVAFQTGSDPTAYANLYPGAPYSTPGRFDDSIVRIPALATLQEQDVRYRRLGVTASYQWQISDRTRLTLDGLLSNFRNISTNYQIQTVGLNRNNTNATYNTAGNTLSPNTARGLYPGLCVPNAGSDIVPAQDCGQQLYGTTPVFSTALNSANQLVSSVLGAAAVVPGGTTPSNANTYSVNPYNLDPYDYYNNRGSVGYIPSSNRLAFRGELIGRPAVDVLESHVSDGVADYLVLRNVDFRSAADQSAYTTKFRQGSFNLTQQFTDIFKGEFLFGRSRSKLFQQGLLVEFNRMDSPGSFVYDEREGGSMPIIDFGFDAADPNNWQTVKGFSAIRHFQRFVTNKYQTIRADFDWQANDRFNVAFGGARRRFTFETEQWERNNDLLNPTLLEAGVSAASVGKTISFGQGLDLPEGTATSFFVPTIQGFQQLFDFTCNCINKWGDWRITNLRNGGRENFGVKEVDTAFYLQLDWDLDLFGAPFRGNFGSRMVTTDVTSNGTTTAGRPILGKNTYTDWLPSVNLIYEPIRNMLFRFGMSKVMARPYLGNLSPSITAISIPNTGATTGATMTIGNPKLSPFYSTNKDFSAEWYFRKGSLISLALFDKKISSFPQTVVFSAPLSTFLDAASIEALKAQFTNQNQLNYIAGDYTVDARQFRDAPGGYIRGFEGNLQVELDFLPGFLSDFGVLLNYTYIKSKLNYIIDPGTNATASAPFLNVSPRALNGTLYYERGPFKGRVSVAHRKGYITNPFPLATGTCNPGVCDSPLINDFAYSGATTNVDFSASYQVTKFFSVTAEGLNITNQTNNRSAYASHPVVTQYSSTGPMYRIGARLKF